MCDENNNMPRKNVPHRVDEIADSILKRLKKDKQMSEDKMYSIAYGTAWKQYRKENPKSNKGKKSKKTSEALLHIRLAETFDSIGEYRLADLFTKID